MNRFTKNKLKLSKWTAVSPVNREKHFIVTKVIDAQDGSTHVVLEAIHSQGERVLPWVDLKDHTRWRMGWR